MTTTTALTWPTAAELEATEQHLRVAANAIDELHLRYYQLDKEMDREGHEGVRLEVLGKLACFIEHVDMELGTIEGHMTTIRSAFHRRKFESCRAHHGKFLHRRLFLLVR